MNSNSANRQYESQQNSGRNQQQQQKASTQSSSGVNAQQAHHSEQASHIPSQQQRSGQTPAQAQCGKTQPSQQQSQQRGQQGQQKGRSLPSEQLNDIPTGTSFATPTTTTRSSTTAITLTTTTAVTVSPVALTYTPRPTVAPYRPSSKPSLLTDKEFAELWDPQLDKLRLGVLLPLNTSEKELDALVIRKGLSAIKLAVKHMNDRNIIPAPLKRIKNVESRIQVLIASGNTQLDVLNAARNAGLMSEEYAWVTSNEISSAYRNRTDRRDFDGLVMVDNGWNLSGYGPYDDFLREWAHLNTTEYPGAGQSTLENNEALAYSCAMMIAEAYAEVLRRSGMPGGQPNQTMVQAIIKGDMTGEIVMTNFYKNRSFKSPAGPITLNAKGDRVEGYYVVASLQDGYPHNFGLIMTGNYSTYTRPMFKNGSTIPPHDAPLWAVQNPTWHNTGGVILGTASIIVILTTASICIAQVFLLPLGVTLLVGALTVKNYRIYRIFNSVGFSNDVFQTRLLMRYVLMIVALCIIPPIIQVIMDKPRPMTINIRQYQWIQCQSNNRTSWFIGSAILPFVLVLFGVYLAFRTRNVVFLWNEARQIALVH
ncbi:hypothetical protein BGZ73_003033 [Actinomortierella ambigua]|nr:hypothetical protein BGZ73_003033 [Actinomortierella ambigua]